MASELKPLLKFYSLSSKKIKAGEKIASKAVASITQLICNARASLRSLPMVSLFVFYHTKSKNKMNTEL